jgi:hypothetical protein
MLRDGKLKGVAVSDSAGFAGQVVASVKSSIFLSLISTIRVVNRQKTDQQRPAAHCVCRFLQRFNAGSDWGDLNSVNRKQAGYFPDC